MRCAILDRMGKSIGSPETYVKLLEDAVIERIGEMVHNGDLLEMWYEGRKNDVDLMIWSKDGKQNRLRSDGGVRTPGRCIKKDPRTKPSTIWSSPRPLSNKDRALSSSPGVSSPG